MHDRTEKEIHFSVRVFKATVPKLPALFHILYKSPLRMSILGHTLITSFRQVRFHIFSDKNHTSLHELTVSEYNLDSIWHGPIFNYSILTHTSFV